jgi:uncharacterized protein (TIGR02246 family)
MRTVHVALSLLLLAVAGNAQVHPVPANQAEVANAMVHRFIDSWNHADGDAYGENYWPEAELVDPSGAIVDGKAAIVKEHVDMWNGPFKGSRATGHVRAVRMLGSKYMMVDFDVQVANVRGLPPGSPKYPDGTLRNHLKHILELRNGQWKVVAAQNTFIAPRP